MDQRWSPPPGWQQVPAWQPPAGPSGLLKASGVLMLVGAILSAAGAVLIIGMGLLFGSVFGALESSASGSEGMPFSALIGGFYVVYGVVAAAGAVCQFVAWGKISRRELQAGFVWGLVGALLPPLNILALLGAIFAKTCPEAEAASQQSQQRYGWPPPPQAR